MGTIYTFQHLTDAGTLASGDQLLVHDVSAARARVTTIGELQKANSGPLYVQLFDDFLGDVIADEWSAAEGNDDLAVIATISQGIGGLVRQTTGNTVTLSESGVVLTAGLNWQASNGGLSMEAKIIPVSSVADCGND